MFNQNPSTADIFDGVYIVSSFPLRTVFFLCYTGKHVLGIDFSTNNRAFVQAFVQVREKTTCVSDAPDFRSVPRYCCKCGYKHNVFYTYASHEFKMPVRKITLNERRWYGVLKTIFLGAGTIFKREILTRIRVPIRNIFCKKYHPTLSEKIKHIQVQDIAFGRFWAMPYWVKHTLR